MGFSYKGNNLWKTKTVIKPLTCQKDVLSWWCKLVKNDILVIKTRYLFKTTKKKTTNIYYLYFSNPHHQLPKLKISKKITHYKKHFPKKSDLHSKEKLLFKNRFKIKPFFNFRKFLRN